jgi:hypothetical protein
VANVKFSLRLLLKLYAFSPFIRNTKADKSALWSDFPFEYGS